MSLVDPKNDFADVELAPNVNAGSHFFIETSTGWSLFTTSLLLATFVIMHVWAALHGPAFISHKDEFFPINETKENASYDVDVALTQLRPAHRFVGLNGSLIGKIQDKERDLFVELSHRATTYNASKPLDIGKDERQQFYIHFTPDSNKSSSFHLGKVLIGDIVDQVQIRLTVQCDYTDILGFHFRWDYFTANVEKYTQTSKLLLSLLLAYMVGVFAFYLTFDAESWTQIFVLVLGVTGILSSNPIMYLFPSASGLRVADFILMSVYIAVFRMFLLLQLELLRSRKTAPNILLAVFIGLFFAFHATVDAAANYDRKNHVLQLGSEVAIVLQTEFAAMITDGVYVAVSLIWLIVAIVMNANTNVRRLWYFGGTVVATGLVTLFTRVYCVLTGMWMDTARPPLIFVAVHSTLAAIAVFFLHSAGGPEYADINAKEQAMVLDIEQASDNEPVDDEEEDGEEE
jgi:hypothetical protein